MVPGFSLTPHLSSRFEPTSVELTRETFHFAAMLQGSRPLVRPEDTSGRRAAAEPADTNRASRSQFTEQLVFDERQGSGVWSRNRVKTSILEDSLIWLPLFFRKLKFSSKCLGDFLHVSSRNLRKKIGGFIFGVVTIED